MFNTFIFEVLVSSCLVFGGMAAAQTMPVAPPPKPPDEQTSANGPSLAATLQFIQQKMTAAEPVVIRGVYTSPSTGESVATYCREAVKNATVDLNSCRITGLSSAIEAGTDSEQLVDIDISFATARDVVVSVYDYQLVAHDRNLSDLCMDPGVSVLVVRPADSQKPATYLYFRDPELADRIARAMAHAIELCGGGGKEPF